MPDQRTHRPGEAGRNSFRQGDPEARFRGEFPAWGDRWTPLAIACLKCAADFTFVQVSYGVSVCVRDLREHGVRAEAASPGSRSAPADSVDGLLHEMPPDQVPRAWMEPLRRLHDQESRYGPGSGLPHT